MSKKNNLYELIKDPNNIERIKYIAKEKGFLNEKYESTEQGKKIKIKDNILCIEEWANLKTKEKFIRCIPIFLSCTIFAISLFSQTKINDKILTPILIALVILPIVFLFTISISHLMTKAIRESAKELNISTTSVQAVAEEISTINKNYFHK